MESKVVVGITHGDINGISYEVILKTLIEPKLAENIIPVIYGSSKVAAFYRKNLNIQGLNINQINNAKDAHPKKINLINCVDDDIKVEIGKSTPEAGISSFKALEAATADLSAGLIDVLLTAPINKENVQNENFKFPGHTEYLEEKIGGGAKALMLMVDEQLKVAVVTGHIPVNQITQKITKESIVEKIKLLNDSLKRDFTIIRPRIAVLGINPHAGDNGIIGNEENEIVIPAIKEAAEQGLLAFGPYAADGFFGSQSYQKFDGVLAMYHDQGLTPFKTLARGGGVNYTAGLPFVRTSPAHGTAYELAGENKADEKSFRDALFMAADIYLNRKQNDELSANPLKTERRNEKSNNRIA